MNKKPTTKKGKGMSPTRHSLGGAEIADHLLASGLSAGNILGIIGDIASTVGSLMGAGIGSHKLASGIGSHQLASGISSHQLGSGKKKPGPKKTVKKPMPKKTVKKPATKKTVKKKTVKGGASMDLFMQ